MQGAHRQGRDPDRLSADPRFFAQNPAESGVGALANIVTDKGQ